MTKEIQEVDKGLIIMKAIVIGLFIALLVAMAVFFIMQSKKDQEKVAKAAKCKQSAVIEIASEIDEVEEQGKFLNVITKVNKEINSQEIIRINTDCANEINRIEFKIRGK